VSDPIPVLSGIPGVPLKKKSSEDGKLSPCAVKPIKSREELMEFIQQAARKRNSFDAGGA
jgi:hypothetical protein